jgi:CheY-like chemotaxis protein
MGSNLKRRRSEKILLVDDEPAILELLREILDTEGYALVTAENGAAALEIVLQNDYDLIITDFRMPKLSGKGLYEKAKTAKPGIEDRFIFISGEMDPTIKTKFIEETGVRVIAKPFRSDLVRTTVRDALETLSHRSCG